MNDAASPGNAGRSVRTDGPMVVTSKGLPCPPTAPRPARWFRVRPGFGVKLGRRGSAVVEFALVAAPLMTMLSGFIATTMMFFTWATMQDSAQFAARMISTGQIKTFTNGAITLANNTSTVTCSGTFTPAQAEYYACLNLPPWATFTVTATEDCAVPSVSVAVSVSAHNAAMADIYALFTGKTLVARSVVMKEGLCP